MESASRLALLTTFIMYYCIEPFGQQTRRGWCPVRHPVIYLWPYVRPSCPVKTCKAPLRSSYTFPGLLSLHRHQLYHAPQLSSSCMIAALCREPHVSNWCLTHHAPRLPFNNLTLSHYWHHYFCFPYAKHRTEQDSIPWPSSLRAKLLTITPPGCWWKLWLLCWTLHFS